METQVKLLVSFLFFSILNLYANTELKKNYFINSKIVKLSDITGSKRDTTVLYTIPKERHSKRVKSKELLKSLKKLGYNNFSAKHSYIQFNQKSPIDMSKITSKLKSHYITEYQNITISDLYMYPRTYLTKLPENYEIYINKRAHLKNRGTLYIRTQDNRKIFFNYKISAKISALVAKYNIKKDDELSIVNLQKKSIMLDKFRAMPLQEVRKATLQAKHRIKKGVLLTTRDTTTLVLVKRGSQINVTVVDTTISISFLAKANQNGRYGESISVTNSNGKRLKVIVTGRNRAEIR